MNDAELEGTLVLEQLARAGLLEDFSDAVDSDDAERATSLMERAEVDASTIALVIAEMAGTDD